jgi:Tfp pilus assembly protein PilF
MKIRKLADYEGWFQLSLVVIVLALMVVVAPPASGDNPAAQQLEFGTDMARRGLWSEALFRFQQADRLEPGNPRVLNNIAVSFEALGLFDQALEAYQAALRASPQDREVRGNYSSFAEFYQNFRPRDDEGTQEASDDSAPSAGAEVGR